MTMISSGNLNNMPSGLEILWLELHIMLESTQEWLKNNQIVQRWLEMCQEYPILSLCVTITASLCSIPLIAFATFILGVMLALLLAFLFIEGTLLMAGLVLLSGVLMVISAAVVSIGASAVAILAVCNRLQHLVMGVKKTVTEDGVTPAYSTSDNFQRAPEKGL
ncbi:uncharacterized protein LOC106465364 [Limulus polyphemus]|uniref:Uncharacterized protein LOC106465364 n=1 Tax=Limulus polyphemus TaxID=6850 RepID=A0ABM1BFM9_LIMPO|nr:uncharacterized protein LOC106465364 [Limulus polyphemus]